MISETSARVSQLHPCFTIVTGLLSPARRTRRATACRSPMSPPPTARRSTSTAPRRSPRATAPSTRRSRRIRTRCTTRSRPTRRWRSSRLLRSLGSRRRRELRRRDRRRAARRVHPAARSSSPASARRRAELAQAIDLGVKTINAESEGELERIDAMARARQARARVAIRVNPDIDAQQPSAHLDRPQDQQVRRLDRRRARACAGACATAPASRSSACTPTSARRSWTSSRCARAAAAMVELATRAARRRARRSSISISAAGSASRTTARVAPTAQEYADGRAARSCADSGLSIVLEPGRQHRRAGGRAADAGRRRQGAAGRQAVRDPRCRDDRADPADALQRLPPHRAGRDAATARRCSRDVVGPLCESSDTLGKDRRLPRPEVGDLFAVLDAGAYGCRDGVELQPPAAAAEVHGRRTAGVTVIRRRQTIDDLLALEASHDMVPAITHAGIAHRLRGPRSERQADAGRVAARLFDVRRVASAELLSFPDYSTAIGDEISRALHGERDYPPDVLQLLYVANRGEKRPQIDRLDRCRASWSSAIATSRRASPTVRRRGSTPRGSREIQRFLPAPHLTILLDIAPETAVGRKAAGARSVRARSGAARPRPRQLPPSGSSAGLGAGSKASAARPRSAADVISAVETRLALP